MNKRKISVLLSVLFSFGYTLSGYGSFLGRKRTDPKSEVSVVFNVSPQAHGGQVTQHAAQQAVLGRGRRNRLETLLIRDALNRKNREICREREEDDALAKLTAQYAALAVQYVEAEAENKRLKEQIAAAVREKRDKALRLQGRRDALELLIAEQ